MIKRLTALLLTLVMLLTLPGLDVLASNASDNELDSVEAVSEQTDTASIVEDKEQEETSKVNVEQVTETTEDKSQSEEVIQEKTNQTDLTFAEVLERAEESLDGLTMQEFMAEQLTAENVEQLKVKTSDLATEAIPFWLETSVTKDAGVIVTIFGDKDFLSDVGEVELAVSLENSKEPFFEGTITSQNPWIQIENITPDSKYLILAKITDNTDITSYVGQFTVITKATYVCSYSFIKEEYKSADFIKKTVQALEMRSLLERVSDMNTKSFVEISPLAGQINYESEWNNDLDNANDIYDDDTMYGRISHGEDEDFFRVIFNEDGNANFWLGDIPTGKNYYLVLENDNGSWLAEGVPLNNQRQLYSFPVEAGRCYYLHIFGGGVNDFNASEYYRLRVKNYPITSDDYGDSFSEAQTVNEDSTTVGRITQGGDIDFLKFYAPRTGIYAFHTIESGTSLDTYGYLYDSNYMLLDESDDGGRGTNFNMTRRLEGNQWYYISIRGFDSSSSGVYRFDLEYRNDDYDDYHDELYGAAQVNVGSLLGMIEHTEDEDCFKFRPEYTGTYDFSTTGSSLDSFGYLYDEAENLIGQDDDSGDGSNFKISEQLTAGQWYYIRVRAYSPSSTGSYALLIERSISDDHANNFQNATRTYEGNTAGNIDYAGDEDYFVFYPTSSGIYDIYTSGSLDNYGYLYNSSQSLLKEDDDSGDGNNFKISQQMTSGYAYYIRTKAYSSNVTGSYTLMITRGADINNTSLSWPTDSAEVTLWFGRQDILFGSNETHKGLNIQGNLNAYVYSIGSGVVDTILTNTSNNKNVVYVNFSLNNVEMQVRYGNLSSVNGLSVGKIVSKGAIIGQMGLSDNTESGKGVVEIVMLKTSNSQFLDPNEYITSPELSSYEYLGDPMAVKFDETGLASSSMYTSLIGAETNSMVLSSDTNTRYIRNLDITGSEAYLRKIAVDCARKVNRTVTADNIETKGYLSYNATTGITTVKINGITKQYGVSLGNARNVNDRLVVNKAQFWRDFAGKKAIVIIPGIAGSSLKDSTGNKVWLTVFPSDIEKMYCTTSGSSINTIAPVTNDYGVMSYYYTLLSRLEEAFGDTHDIIFFPYDWRLSNDDAARKLALKINTDYDSVILVAHSMGGLVASKYISNSSVNRDKVEKLITIATPYTGAPQALYVAETGDFNKMLSGVGCSDEIMEMARNLPAFYELMPTARNMDYAYIQAGDTDYSGSAARTYYSNLNWAKNGSSIKPMYNTATAFHASLILNGTHVANSSSVDCYKIFGLGEDTPYKIVYDTNGNYLRTEKNTSGDGTVMQDSATNTLLPTLANKTYQFNDSHTGLLSNLSCLYTIIQIIRGTVATASQAPELQVNDRGWIIGEDNRRIYIVFDSKCSVELHDGNNNLITERDGDLYNISSEKVGSVWLQGGNKTEFCLFNDDYKISFDGIAKPIDSIDILYQNNGYYEHGIKYSGLPGQLSLEVSDYLVKESKLEVANDYTSSSWNIQEPLIEPSIYTGEELEAYNDF